MFVTVRTVAHPIQWVQLAPFTPPVVSLIIPAAAALRIATINGARAMGVSDKLGTIETGKLADLLVVRGNPLVSITNTRNARVVVKSGIVYDPAALLASAEGKIGMSPKQPAPHTPD